MCHLQVQHPSCRGELARVIMDNWETRCSPILIFLIQCLTTTNIFYLWPLQLCLPVLRPASTEPSGPWQIHKKLSGALVKNRFIIRAVRFLDYTKTHHNSVVRKLIFTRLNTRHKHNPPIIHFPSPTPQKKFNKEILLLKNIKAVILYPATHRYYSFTSWSAYGFKRLILPIGH